MLVREYLRKAPVTVPPECTVMEAAGIMATHGVGSLLVAYGGELPGLLTGRDIVVRGVSTGNSLQAHVSSLMTEHPTTVQGASDVVEPIKPLRESGVRRPPVLEDTESAGIITVDDLLVWLVLELGAVTTPVAGHSPAAFHLRIPI